MTYGLMVDNLSGELVISSEGFGLAYIGKATYDSDVGAPSLEFDTLRFGTYTTFKKYVITSSVPIAAFVKLTSGLRSGIASVTQSGSTWEIIVFNQNGSNVVQAADVYCFARPTSLSASYGLALYDSSGALAYDLTGGVRPLFFKGVVDFLSTDSSIALPGGITTPAAFGFSCGYVDPSPVLISVPFNRYRMDGQLYGLSLSGSNITRNLVKFRDGPNEDFGPGESPAAGGPGVVPFTVYLIDCNGLT